MISRLVGVCAIAAALGGCLQPRLVDCGDKLCPAGDTCVANELCASDEQLAECNGKADGETCIDTRGAGICDRGVCVVSGCGNGEVEAGEACDDGNAIGGDGCSADCRKLEMCGDSVVDEGEACDDGNTNPADGCDACTATAWHASAIIGGQVVATDLPIAPSGIVVAPGGDLFVGDGDRIYRIDTQGNLTKIAGSGSTNSALGDGGPATSATLGVAGLALDGLGNLYVADSSHHRVRMIDSRGIITTIAGTGTAGFSGDGTAALGAMLNTPTGVAVDGLGNVFVSDRQNHRIRRIDAAGIITTIAGIGSAPFGGDGGPATSAALCQPTAIGLDGQARLLILDSCNVRVRRIQAGTITTVAGGGAATGEGVSATTALLQSPGALTVAANGAFYVSETNNIFRVRRVDPSGIINTVVGTGAYGPGGVGDGGLALAAQVARVGSLALDATGALYLGDTSRLRKVDPSQIINTIAGTGSYRTGDGGAATSAQLGIPNGITITADGTIYLADWYDHRVRKIALDGTITTVAGTGTAGYSGDGGPATAATLDAPRSVAFDSTGTMYVADTYNCVVRKVATDGTISTYAGTHTCNGPVNDGGPATSAGLNYPEAVLVDSSDRLLVGDSENNRVRRIDSAGTITTIAGTGTCDSTGDNGPATAATLCAPSALFLTGQTLYVADTNNFKIRKIDAGGTITLVAGNGGRGFSGDNGPATSAMFDFPYGVVVDGTGNVFIADQYNNRIRKVSGGTITTIAGAGAGTFTGDGGPATAATIRHPLGLAFDPQGRLVIADSDNAYLRRIETDGTISSIAGAVDVEGMGRFAQGRMADARALVLGPDITLIAGGASHTVQAARETAGILEVVAGEYPATSAVGNRARYRGNTFGEVGGLAFDAAAGRAYVTETSKNQIDVITIPNLADKSTWTIAPLSTNITLRSPTGLLLDTTNQILYVAETGNHAVRAVALPTGTTTTIAGVPGTRGFFGDGGAATAGLLYGPRALTRCANGDFFIADSGNHRVRRIDAATGHISTVVGVGVATSSGDGTPASSFPVDTPLGLACDDRGNLAVTSTNTVRFLVANDAGIIDGTGPLQTIYGAPPRDQFPEAATRCLTGIVATSPTTLRVADSCAGLLVELKREAAP